MSENNVDEQVEDKFGADADPMETEDAANSDLAESALAEAEEDSEKSAEESAEKPEDQVPLSKYMGVKTSAREARDEAQAAKIEAAELRGKMAGMQERQVTEAELSPMQALMKEQDVDDVDHLDISAGKAIALAKQEVKWDAAQAAKTTAADAETTRQGDLQTQQVAAKEKDRGDGLGYGDIVDMGEKFLTEGDKLDIRNSKEPFETAYSRCLRAIQERGDDSTKKTLQENLARKTKESAADDPPNKGAADEDETDDEEVDDNHIVNPRLRALTADHIAGGSGAG